MRVSAGLISVTVILSCLWSTFVMVCKAEGKLKRFMPDDWLVEVAERVLFEVDNFLGMSA